MMRSERYKWWNGGGTRLLLVAVLLMQVVIVWGIFRRVTDDDNAGNAVRNAKQAGGHFHVVSSSMSSDPVVAAIDSMMSSTFHDMAYLHSLVRFDDNWDSLSLSPTMDMRSDKAGYLVLMSIPGVNTTNLDVSLNGRVLTVCSSREVDNKHYHGVQHFEKRILLPGEIGDVDGVHAEVTNGLLRVHVPRGSGSGHHKVRINLY